MKLSIKLSSPHGSRLMSDLNFTSEKILVKDLYTQDTSEVSDKVTDFLAL